jgi:hypothetical protein
MGDSGRPAFMCCGGLMRRSECIMEQGGGMRRPRCGITEEMRERYGKQGLSLDAPVPSFDSPDFQSHLMCCNMTFFVG